MVDRRIGLLFAGFLVLLCLAVGRALWVQGIQGAGSAPTLKASRPRPFPVPGLRGSILDRKGRELAVSEDAVDVVATPYQVKDPNRVAHRLAPILDVSREGHPASAWRGGSSGFAYIARGWTCPTAGKIADLGLPGSPPFRRAGGCTRRASLPGR